jgi:helicase required for RNAi-mediated heterochromatin assembly 1
LKGLLLSRIGAAFRLEFSNQRAGKQIRWKNSKRLLPGTVVALTPSSDMFSTKCMIAIVAARPLQGGLDQNPPSVDLFWGNSDDAVIDPVDGE